MKVKVETTSGITTIEMEAVIAITETIEQTGMKLLNAPAFRLDLHMANGSIFTANVTEAEKVVIFSKWGAE